MPVIWSSQLWVEVSPNADEEITTTALDIKHLGCRLKPVNLGDVYGARGTCIALRMTTTLLSAVSVTDIGKGGVCMCNADDDQVD